MMGQYALTFAILAGICFDISFGVVAAPAPKPATTAAPGDLRCQEDNGTMLPTATVCDDELSSTTCLALFGPEVNKTSTHRDVNCDNDELQDKALQCARTCGICCEKPEYDCEDSKSAPFNCTQNKRYCTQAQWTTVMSQYCPQTCGLCNAGTGCRDQITGCASMVGLCENINFYTYMQTNCKRSCGLCNSLNGTFGNCNDQATNCAASVSLCNNSVYYDLMTQKCGKTCNRCTSSGIGGNTSCSDTNSNCQTWVRSGFCNNSFYTQDQKRQYCGRSCSLC